MIIHPDAVDDLIARMKAAGFAPVETDVQWSGPTCYGREVYQVPSDIIGDVRTVDVGAVRDPAFMDRESNPTVAIRTEDGGVIWRDEDDPSAWDFANHVAGVFEVPLSLVRPSKPL